MDNLTKSIIGLLRLLRQLYEDEVVPTMVDAGDHADRIEEIDEVLRAIRSRTDRWDRNA